jgi:purine-nucleoside phosphorylase
MSDDAARSGRAGATEIETYRRHVDAAVEHLQEAVSLRPRIGLILGTGLGSLADDVEIEATVPYEELPHFPTSTVESHEGHLGVGTLDGVPVAVMQGRMHLYEGYTAREVTFPIRVLGEFGVDTLLISNAAGGMNTHFRESDLMLITDHINFQGANPLVGPNVDDWGPRFPDMSEPYDVELREAAHEVALDAGFKLQQGVYVSVLGPNLETKAEYRFLRQIGGDAVGMSTVPEVIVARHMGIRVMAVSVITDECFPDALEPVDIQSVLAAAEKAGPNLSTLIRGVVKEA